jgi:hypothetical protein
VLTSRAIGHQDQSLFSAQSPVPSTARVEKKLRAIVDDSGTVLDARTVEVLCERIQETARLLADLSLTEHPTDRAESFRYLLAMVAYAVDASLLNADALEPMFSQPYRLHLLDWGGASPDAVYRRTMIRDDRSYRVHGRLGNAKYLSMDLRQSSPTRTLTREVLDAAADGSFEIFLGGAERDGRWWPLSDGSSGIVVRELFDDWLAAERSHLRIECLDGEPAPRPEHNAQRVAAEFDAIGDWVLEGGVRYWAERSTILAEAARNSFVTDLYRGDTLLPTTTFGWWDLAPDEALVVELRDPEAEFWGMHLVSSLWHTLDYANRLITFNLAQAHRDDDGRYRFVVSAQDPGVHNWLDTMGLERGVIILRLWRAANAGAPTAELVKLAEVGERSTATKRCSPDERRAQIAERREGVTRMLCD